MSFGRLARAVLGISKLPGRGLVDLGRALFLVSLWAIVVSRVVADVVSDVVSDVVVCVVVVSNVV